MEIAVSYQATKVADSFAPYLGYFRFSLSITY